MRYFFEREAKYRACLLNFLPIAYIAVRGSLSRTRGQDPMVGMACDSDDDDDLCEDDIILCVNGSLTCVDLAPPANRVEVR